MFSKQPCSIKYVSVDESLELKIISLYLSVVEQSLRAMMIDNKILDLYSAYDDA